eukprot:GFUD01002435.1.p1 GENE.GFUD01002435.1~~GFUD01002435.1.p1  ORF type:complete len:267 (-),score=89.36 GFUD01002435.1:28-828(-)
MSNQVSRTFLITGSTDGIGLHTAAKLAALGHSVILHGRSQERLASAVSRVREHLVSPGQVYHVLGDLASMTMVREVARQVREKVDSIDCIINNAGVFMPEFQQSTDGHEVTFAVNVLAHYLLTNLLKDLLATSPTPRLINTSSISQSSSPPAQFQLTQANYNPHTAYEQSKLFDRMVTVHQARVFPSITCLSLDPGTISTKMLEMGWGCGGTPLHQANDTLWLATSQEVSLASTGNYYVGGRARTGHSFSDEDVQNLINYLDSLIR